MDIIGNSFVNSIVLSLFATVTGAAVTWLFASRANARRDLRDAKAVAVSEAATLAVGHQKLVDQVASMTERLALVTAQVVPFSTAFQQILVAQLTHSHTPELDALLAKIGPPITLTVEEEQHMYKLLQERQRDVGALITEEERDAAIILPYIMKRARREQADLVLAEGLRLQLVGVTAMVGVPVGTLELAVKSATNKAEGTEPTPPAPT